MRELSPLNFTKRISQAGVLLLTGALVFLVVFGSGARAGPPELSSPSPPVFQMHFLDVGQGDAILVQSPEGRAVLYDGGERGSVLMDALTDAGVSALELVIASHAHADHIGGLIAAVEAMPPRFFLDNGIPHTTQTYARLMQTVGASGAQLLEPEARTLTLDGVQLHVLPPPGEPGLGHNDNSLGLIIEYGGFRAFLGGDAEGHLWAWWIENHPERLAPVQVLKASHHGSFNGDTAEGLAYLSPEVVVIGTGAGNTYGHPHPDALARYASVGATVYRTDRHGTVTVLADSTGAFSITTTRSEGLAPEEGGVLSCVDLNAADWLVLQRLPGVGPVVAGGILEARQDRPFVGVDDLIRVRGVGVRTLERIAASGMVCE